MLYAISVSGRSVATDISLQNYLKKMNQLLEESRYPEVIQHAQHVLKHFSRHVPTYLVLGQALLEQQDFSGTIDLLQRVLSTKPNEFVAHLGLSIAYSEEGLYPQAMWHLLRANEMDPYNTNIQRELRELYRQQHGDYLPEIPISQAALARLHFKGGQYSHAISGLQDSLAAADEDRVDLELLLAEALWRNKERIEAAKICDKILQKLPNCITANAILAEIYLQGERVKEANTHLQLVQTLTQMDQVQLDVSTAEGAAFSAPNAMTLPREVLLPQLENNLFRGTPSSETGETPTIADWVSEFGLDETIDEDNDLYDWLNTGAAAAEETAVVEEPPSWLERNLEDELEPIQLAPEQVAEWEAPLADESLFAATETEESIPDWLQSEPVGQTTEFVATLNEQFDVMEDSVSDDKGKKSKPVADDAKSDSVDDALSWLDDLIDPSDVESAAQPAAAAASSSEDLPDWLKDLSDKANQPEATPNDELPDWLKEAALTSETTLPGVLDKPLKSDEAASSLTDEVVEAEITPIDTDLSWLDKLVTETTTDENDLVTMTWQDEAADDAEQSDSTESETPQDLDEAMAWLEDLAAEQDTPIEEPPTVAQGLFGTEILKPETAVPDPIADEDDGVDEAMAWLDELAGEDDTPSLAEATRDATNSALEVDDPPANEPGDTMMWLDELASNESALAETGQLGAVNDDLADALDWLEAQTVEPAAAQPMSDPSAEDVANLDDDLSWLEALATDDSAAVVAPEVDETVVEATTTALDFELETPKIEAKPPLDMPEDPDEALAWLEQLAADTYQLEDEPVEAEAEAATATAEVAPVVAEAAAEAEQTVDDLLDVPEDPDEAMAWLEQLAARQGAPLDELPSLADVDEAVVEEAEVVEETAVVADDLTEADADAISEPPEDLDDAMAWLEQLAANQGAPLDELPSLSEAEIALPEADTSVAEMAAEDEADSSDSLIAGLAAGAAAGAVAGVATEMFTDGAESDAEGAIVEEAAEADDLTETDADADAVSEPPDDLDDAMAWLEQLAANQGAPLDELPSLSEADVPEVEAVVEEAEIVEETAVVADDLTEADAISEPPEDLDDAMAWLEQLAANQGAPLDELPSLSEADVPEVEAVVEEAEIVEETAVVADDLTEADADAISEPPEDLDDAMAWLEQLAANQGAPLDELPSLSEADVPEIELPEAEASIAELSAEDEADSSEGLIAGLAAGVAAGAVAGVAADIFTDDAESSVDEVATTDAALDEELVDAVPDDPDEAMAWLEQLAARQGAPLDELPSLSEADDEPANTGNDEVELGEDPMAWLNELMDGESDEAAVEEMTIVESAVAPEAMLAEAEEAVPEVVEETAVVAADLTDTDAVSEPPDDLDDAMAWLEQLAANQGAPLEELPSLGAASEPESGDVLPAEGLDAEAVDEAGVVSDLMSDDPMAWLDELAAEQGVELQDEAAEASVEETAVVAEADSETGVSPDAVDDALAWLDELAADTSADEDADDVPAEAEAAETEMAEAEAEEETAVVAPATDEDEALPDWLAGEQSTTGAVGDTGWLRSIAEPNVTGWLASEEEVTTGALERDGFGTDALEDILEADPLSEPPAHLPVLEEPAPEVGNEEIADEDQLVVARRAVADGDTQTAVGSYRSLLDLGDGLGMLIADLEDATAQMPQQPKLQQLLGDAYSRNGQLQKALNTYRDALNAL